MFPLCSPYDLFLALFLALFLTLLDGPRPGGKVVKAAKAILEIFGFFGFFGFFWKNSAFFGKF
jgi:hypothetical protein